MKKEVSSLINIIRFTPPILIIIVCIFLITLTYQEQKNEFELEKNFIEKQFIEYEKNRIKENVNTMHSFIKDRKQEFEKELREDIYQRINNAHEIATNIYNKNRNRKSKTEIIEQIKDSLEVFRFNEGRGYFSIHTIEGINILQPINKAFEGTSVFYRKDVKGNYPVQMAINIAKKKNYGFFSWYYYKPKDKSKEFKKIGIVKKFEPYNLIITTAEYVEDFNKNLQKKTLEHISNLKYKNDGFIFILSYDGKMILHKSENIINYNIFEDKRFSHVKSFFKKFVKDERNDAFIETIPTISEGINTNETKITYVKKFEESKWIIAKSFKLSNIQKTINEKKLSLEEKYTGYKNDILTFGIIFTLLLLFISYLASKSLENRFLRYKEKLEKQITKNVRQKETLLKAQEIAHIGDWKLNIITKKAFWSNEIIRIFGLDKIDKDKFGIEYLKNIIHEDDISSFKKSINNCITSQKEYQCIYRIIRANGEIRWIDSRGKLDKDKNLIIGTIQDITENKRLEIEKQEQEELLYQQSKLAAMGEMIGNIAHQWRQPLSAISTSATGAKLQKEMNMLSDENFNHTMDTINDSAQYLSQTIEDFRSFFDVRNNEKREFSISGTINKTLNLVSSQFTAKEIEIIQNIEDISIMSLENELIQVLVNILNNSRDALIKTENQKRFIFINTFRQDNKLIIEIKDNANGISRNIIDRIFEPYFTTKHQSLGTGIGLYISRNILINHLEGSIQVKNETYTYEGVEYKGAKFIITIDILT